MKYIIEDNIVYVQPNSNIDDIFTVNATYTSFCFEKGDFFITNKKPRSSRGFVYERLSLSKYFLFEIGHGID